MKRIVAVLVGILFTLMRPINVNAASYGISITGAATFTNNVTLTVSVYGSASAGGACGGICGVTANLVYDKSKIELTSASAQQSFDFTQGTKLVLYKGTAASDGGILTLKFRNIGLADKESTSVSISNIVVSNGDADLNVGNASKTIQYVAPAQPDPTPTPTPTPTPNPTPSGSDKEKEKEQQKPEDSNEKTDDKKEEEKKKSKNASLAGITLSQGDIQFDKDILAYDVIVSESTNEIEIKADTEDEKATVLGVGKHTVNYGANQIKLTVRAEDGSEKEYVINVFREVTPETMARYEKDLEQARLMNRLFAAGLAFFVVVLIVLLILFFVKKKKKTKEEDQFQNAHQDDSADSQPFNGESNQSGFGV